MQVNMFSQFKEEYYINIKKCHYFVGITAYMIVACIWNLSRAMPLLVIWCVVVAYNIYALIRDHFGDSIARELYPLYKLISKNMYWIKW